MLLRDLRQFSFINHETTPKKHSKTEPNTQVHPRDCTPATSKHGALGWGNGNPNADSLQLALDIKKFRLQFQDLLQIGHDGIRVLIMTWTSASTFDMYIHIHIYIYIYRSE